MDSDILHEEVFCFALSLDKISSFCHSCLRSEKDGELKRCIGCKSIYYCNSICQKQDWKFHKLECNIYKQSETTELSEAVRIVARLAISWSIGNFGAIALEHGDRSLATLEYHSESNSLDKMASAFVAEFNEVVKVHIVGNEVLKRLFKVVAVNSFSLTNQLGSSIGVALCIKMSVINHSCKPRTRMAYRHRRVGMVPTDLKRVPVSLDDAFHCYIDDMLPIEQRRKLLKDRYMFDCSCEGCNDKERNERMEAWQCDRCPSGWVPPFEGASCKSCGHVPDEGHIHTCLMAVQSVNAGNQVIQRSNVEQEAKFTLATHLQTMMDGIFHKLNVLRVPVLLQLYANSIANQNFEEAVEYGTHLLDIYGKFRYADDIATVYFKYGLAQVHKRLDQSNKVRELLSTNSLATIGTAHGTDSEIYRNCEIMLHNCK